MPTSDSDPTKLPILTDPQFASLLPLLPSAQAESLQAEILSAGRCHAALVVWQETGVLLDGHHRWGIIDSNPNIDYETVEISLPSRADAIKWIFRHHDNRRMWRSRFEQVEHYINAFSEDLREARAERMKRGKSDPQDNCPKGTWYDDIAELCGGPHIISAKTVQRVHAALDMKDKACKIEDEHQQERTGLAEGIIEDLRSGDSKPGNSKRLFDEMRKQVRRNHAHDNAQETIEQHREDDESELINRIVCVKDTPLEALERIDDDQVGLYFSSYPYYCEKNYGSGEEADNMPYDEQLAFFRRLADEQFRTLRPGGRCVINIDRVTSRPQGEDFTERLRHYKRPCVTDLTNVMRETGFLPMQDHLWYKNNHNYNNCQWGTFASPECPIHIRDWEHCLVYSKPSGQQTKPFTLAETDYTLGADITPSEFQKWLRGIWVIPIEHSDRGGHPCPFPEELAKRVIKIHSYVNDWVIDVFNGSGTTTAVAKQLNRRYTGIDREPVFCKYAMERTDAVIPVTQPSSLVADLSEVVRTLTAETKGNVWNQDCVLGASAHLKDECIDLGICDSPFGIGESNFDRYYKRDPSYTIPGYVEAPDDYEEFSRAWLTQMYRVLKPNGSLYAVSGYTHDHIIKRVALDVGFHLVSTVAWNQNFPRPTKRKFQSSHYPIYLFSKSAKARHTFNLDCRFGQDDKDPDGRSLRHQDLASVWNIPVEPHRKTWKNGNKLPDELIRKMVQYSSNPGDLVCDFFLGNFTSAYVAQSLDRRVTGFEMNPHAFNYHVHGVEPGAGTDTDSEAA